MAAYTKMSERRTDGLATSRRGLATLELALSLPFMVLMVALVLVTADGMVLTSQTTVAARTDALKRSLTHKSQQGVDRFLLEDVATSDRYNRDIVTGSATKKDNVVRVLGSSQISSSAQLAVVRNTWSFTELPLDDDNRLKLYGQVVFAGSLGKLTSIVDQLRGLGSSAASVLEGLGQSSQRTQQDLPELAEARRKQEEARKKREEEKKRIEAEIRRLQTEIAQINKDIQQLRDDLKQAEKDLKDKPDELEAKRKATEAQIAAKEKERRQKEEQLEQRQKELDLIKESEKF